MRDLLALQYVDLERKSNNANSIPIFGSPFLRRGGLAV